VSRLAVASLGFAALLAWPAPSFAVTSNLTRTFTGETFVDFDALSLGVLVAGTQIAPGIVYDGSYPPFVTGVGGTVVDLGDGDRAIELASDETAGFVFDPPVRDVGAAVAQIVPGAQVTVRAFDAVGDVITGFGYIYPSVTERFPEVTEATAPPVTTLLITAQGGTYRVDDLELNFAPEPADAAPVALAVLAAVAHRRQRPRPR
jgi:MYXO-CTERM domain-containing protein